MILKPLAVVRFFLATCLFLSSAALWADDTDGDSKSEDTAGWAIGASMSACVLNNASVHCWGDGEFGHLAVPALTNPTLLAVGQTNACALDDTGVHCWGMGTTDSGDYSGTGEYGQSIVPALSHPTAISAGGAHVCALDDSGVVCWGWDYWTQISGMPALTNPTAVSTGDLHTCALDDNGVHCWGNNDSGRSTVPVLTNPTAVSAGGVATCALDDTGVVCWGDAGTVPSLNNPTAVSVGYDHICALDESGVVCWGNNDYGQTTVPALSNPTAVVAAGYFSCALDDNGVHCWGQNTFNQNNVPAFARPDNCPRAANNDQADTDGDGLGNTCDPIADDGDILNSKDGTVKTDKTGSVVAYAGDFNKDGFGDYAVATPYYDVPAAPPLKAINNAGKLEIFSGNDGSVLYTMVGTPKTGFGAAIAGGGNIDGDADGTADVVVSAPLAADTAGTKAMGKVTVIYGCKTKNCTPATDDIYGTEAKAAFGNALAVGDVDGDGRADVIIGAPNATNSALEKPAKQAGCVSLHLATALQTAVPVGCGDVVKAHAGAALAVGDFNGSGGKEIVIGAPNDDALTNSIPPKKLADAGSVKIYTSGNPTAIYTQYGAATKDYFGKALAAGGDVNKDGMKDVLVGVTGLDDPEDNKLKDVGGFVVLYGSNSNDYYRGDDTLGTTAKSGLGSAVALGDVDKNGFADIIVSAPKAANPNTLPKPTKAAGSVAVWGGAATEPLTLLNDAYYGATTNEGFGTALAAGDTNRDGKADVLVGIPGLDVTVEDKLQKDAGGVMVLNATVFNL